MILKTVRWVENPEVYLAFMTVVYLTTIGTERSAVIPGVSIAVFRPPSLLPVGEKLSSDKISR